MASDTRYLSKQFLTEFIEMYRSHPCLWQVKFKEYTNKNLKNKAYDQLIELCKKIIPDANRVCNEKNQNLRSAFRKELKKVEWSKRSGTSADDVYEPTLWYYDLLLFTLDSETALTSMDNISNIGSPNLDSQAVEDEHDASQARSDEDSRENNNNEDIEVVTRQIFRKPMIELQSTSAKGRRQKRKEQTKELNNFMNVCTEALSTSDKIEEFDAIGINVAAKLRKMDPEQACLAEALLNKVLFKGAFKQLIFNTKITEVPQNQQGPPVGQSTSSGRSSEAGNPTNDYYTNMAAVLSAYKE